MKAFVEAYDDGKQIVKICGDDGAVIERFEVSAVILENNIPVNYRMYPDVVVRLDISRN